MKHGFGVEFVGGNIYLIGVLILLLLEHGFGARRTSTETSYQKTCLNPSSNGTWLRGPILFFART